MTICRRLAKQASGTRAGEPAGGGIARWKHVVIHCYRLGDGHSHRETENRLRCFGELREVLELDLREVPEYCISYKSFDRFPLRRRRALLRSADGLLSLAANKAFYSWISTLKCYTLNVDPLVLKGRIEAAYT